MILEGLVTTLNPDGSPHLAPMGPHMNDDFSRFLLRPFPTSQTYRNLVDHPAGVLHVTDDVLLLAKAALGATAMPKLVPTMHVHGFALADCCRHYEFVVKSIDATGERVHIAADVVHMERHRDFWGFNRAKHAVIEAAIQATRLHILSFEEVVADYHKYRIIVNKTGGAPEREALDFLEAHLQRAEANR